jgi:hypothetical protein
MDEQQKAAWTTLDLEPGASVEEIRAAYRDLAKVWHPDRYQHESERLRNRAEEQMKRITRAFEILTGAAPDAPPAARAPLVMDFGARWGYINETGATVIEPQFDVAREFSGPLAAVRINGKWGYVNLTGGLQVTPLYDSAGDFSEGMAAVEWHGRWGYIDTFGAFTITPRFQEAGPFVYGSAEVRLGARRGRVNRSGEVEFDQFSAGRHLPGGEPT